MVALVDADILCYRAAYSTEGMLPEDAADKFDELLGYVEDRLTFDGQPVELFLTGPGNFRYDIAKSYPYKGNRRDTAKPEHLAYLRDYVASELGAEVSEGEEADDLIAIRATELFPNGIICSIDKDFDQVPGWHYNQRKDSLYWITETEGLVFFYTQILTGDRADNIVGLKGIGPAKAAKILGESTEEVELYDKVLEAYGGREDYVIENARLLWLRREKGQMWQSPK